MVASIFAQYSYVFLGAIFLEAIFILSTNKGSFSLPDSFASLGVAIGSFANGFLSRAVVAAIALFVWQYHWWTIPLNNIWGLILLFLVEEFFYYWSHRLAHRMRWVWASHAVHHSGAHFNLSVAYRLGWTNLISGNYLVFTPMYLLGFHPFAVSITLSINLFYQFWIHTELIPKLGWLEWIFNTPSHHRVHHASNPEYIDRNYGGVLIIYDRLFGTFTKEKRANQPRYGLTRPVYSFNPIRIAFHEWILIYQDCQELDKWSDRLKLLFYPPEWIFKYHRQKQEINSVKPTLPIHQ